MSRSSTPEPYTPAPSPQKQGLLRPVVVSPAESVAPSPDAQDDSSIFDFGSSITPSDATTPLTPPETTESSRDKLPDVVESPLFRKSAIGSSITASDATTPLTPPETTEWSRDKLPDVAESPLLRKTAKTSAYLNGAAISGKRNAGPPIKFDENVINAIKKELDENPIPIFNLKPDTQFGQASKPIAKRVVKPQNPKPQNPPSSAEPPKSTDPSPPNKAKKTGTKKISNDLRKALEQIIPKSIHQRISESGTTCIGSIVRKQTQRCSKKIKDSQDALEALQSLVKAIKENKSAEVLKSVEDILSSAMCTSHFRTAKKPSNYSKLENMLKSLADEVSSHSSIEIEEFNIWIDAVSSKGTEVTEASKAPKVEITGPSQTSSLKEESPTPTTRPEAGYGDLISSLVAIPPFEIFRPKRFKNLSVSSALEKAASKPLGKRDMQEGCIYIFWTEGEFGHIKLGRSNNPERRIMEWNRNCMRDHVFQNKAIHETLPHVNRVETLIHTEMNMLRRQRKCEGCKKNHNEWFCVSERHAAAVFDKWKNWILLHPYVEDQITQQWTLSSAFTQTLDEVCQPIKSNTAPTNSPSPHQRPKLDRTKGRRWQGGRKRS